MTNLNRFHWLYGIREYFNLKSQTKTIDSNCYLNKKNIMDMIIESCLHKNSWRLRDLIVDYKHLLDEETINVFMMSHINSDFLTDINVMKVVRNLVNDPFINNLNEWIIETEIIDLNDHLSVGQIQSKDVVLKYLSLIDLSDIKSIVIYGGWHATISYHIHQIIADKYLNTLPIYNLELDPVCVASSTKFGNIANISINARLVDVTTDCSFDSNGNLVLPSNEVIESPLIINMSSEHIPSTKWFDLIPHGEKVIIQTNDFTSHPDHVMCVNSLNEAKRTYRLGNVEFEHELDTGIYTRFTLGGVK